MTEIRTLYFEKHLREGLFFSCVGGIVHCANWTKFFNNNTLSYLKAAILDFVALQQGGVRGHAWVCFVMWFCKGSLYARVV